MPESRKKRNTIIVILVVIGALIQLIVGVCGFFYVKSLKEKHIDNHYYSLGETFTYRNFEYRITKQQTPEDYEYLVYDVHVKSLKDDGSFGVNICARVVDGCYYSEDLGEVKGRQAFDNIATGSSQKQLKKNEEITTYIAFEKKDDFRKLELGIFPPTLPHPKAIIKVR